MRMSVAGQVISSYLQNKYIVSLTKKQCVAEFCLSTVLTPQQLTSCISLSVLSDNGDSD